MVVTTDRGHAVMIPGRPRPLHAVRQVTRRALDDEQRQCGDDAEDRGGHRTVQRTDEHGPDPAPEEERELRETIQGMKTDSPSVHRRPKQPCKV